MSTVRDTHRFSVGAFLSTSAVVCAAGLLAAGLAGCGGSGGLSASSSAPPLPEFNEQNLSSPYFATGEMNIPRYLHQIIRLADGLVLVVAGSDENGFSAIDTAEIFDQGKLKANEKEPESIRGTWFDTDFEGNPVTMAIPRIFHTITELPDNNVIVIGGAPTITQAVPTGDVEVYDQLTRQFSTLEEEMDKPRFRHAATPIGDGRILISGGQVHDVFTQSQNAVVVGGGQQGQVAIQIQLDIFPSARVSEVFDIIEQRFEPLFLPETLRPALLTPSRGRAGHTTARFAGPDNRINTGDDLYLLVGGYQTLSGENAPQQKFPGQATPDPGVGGGSAGAGAHLSLEFYDPVVGFFTEVLIVRLTMPRINDPQATNLGDANEFTPDGVLGMGNTILICNGDDNEPVGARDTAWAEDEIYVATFTGFGPAQGLQFFKQGDPFFEHNQGVEAFEAEGGLPETGPCLTEPCLGRSQTNIVALPRRLQTVLGDTMTTWVFTGGGVHLWIATGQIIYFGGTIASGVVFDPFYSLTAIRDFDSSARDLRPGRRASGNPVGVIGTWFAIDGLFPDTTIDGFGDTPLAEFAVMRAGERAWTRITPIAGEDGIDDTVDDRVLFAGGGSDPFGPGGEPSFPSSEILLMPGTGSDAGSRAR